MFILVHIIFKKIYKSLKNVIQLLSEMISVYALILLLHSFCDKLLSHFPFFIKQVRRKEKELHRKFLKSLKYISEYTSKHKVLDNQYQESN